MLRRLATLASIRVVLGVVPGLLKSCFGDNNSAFGWNPSGPRLLFLSLFGFLCVLAGDDFVMNARLAKVTGGLVVAALRRHIYVQSATPAMVH